MKKKKILLTGLIFIMGFSGGVFAEQQTSNNPKEELSQVLKSLEDGKRKIEEYTNKLQNHPFKQIYQIYCINKGIEEGLCYMYYCGRNILNAIRNKDCQALEDYESALTSLKSEKTFYPYKLEKGVKLFKTYCQNGEFEECYKLVKFYKDTDYFYGDNGIEKVLEENCDNGNGKYCKVLAEIFPNDKERFLSQGCDKKDGQACMDLALFYKDNGNYDKAVEYAKRTCELKKAGNNCEDVSYINGFVYYYKNKDLNKAIDSFLKSAKVYPVAYCDIGNLQEKKKKKVEFYQKCCDAGIEKGCNEVADLKNNPKRIYAIRVVNDSYDTFSGVKVICGDGTTEYKLMEDNYGEVIAELQDTNFLVKRPIQLKNACNTWYDIFSINRPIPKIRKKLFLVIAQGSLEVKGEKLTPENLANELISINEFISTGTGNGTPHLKFTRIILDIMKQMLVYDKKVSPRVKETISLLLQSRLNQAYSYVDKAVSDAELKKIDDYIKEEYFIDEK